MGLRDWLHSIDPRKKSSAEGTVPPPGSRPLDDLPGTAPTDDAGPYGNSGSSSAQDHDPMVTIQGDTRLFHAAPQDSSVTKGWLEMVGEPGRTELHGTCTIGRLRDSTVCIAHERVSRRHALIQSQGGEFWLVDQGTVNGTFLNKKRLEGPRMLRDGDRITIVSCEMVFHQEVEKSSKMMTTLKGGKYDDVTMTAVEEPEMWLLLADIEGFTPLSQRLAAAELAQLVGTWLQHGRQIIDTHQGTVNKYLGDGYFAYWRHGNSVDKNVLQALRDLHKLQMKQHPPFRVVLHRGIVTVGGAAYAGEESLIGPQVNLVFRLEKLASRLKERCLLTAAALEKLPHIRSTRALGQHSVDGFEEKVTVYGYDP